MFISFLNEIFQNWLQFMGQQVILSTLFFILILLISTLIKRKYVWIHLGLWGLIFVKLILPPNFSFIDQNNQERDLASLRGKVVYLFFWNKWTRIEYIHHVKNIEKELDSDNFVVLSIAIESYNDALRYRDRLMMSWYPIRPVGQLNSDIAHLYRNYVFTDFVINKDGKIRARRYPGYENLKDILERYL
jgi:hypothetical protein